MGWRWMAQSWHASRRRPAASAAVLCRTRSATVKVRDVCRPRERTLDPVALGLQADGRPGNAGAGGTEGRQRRHGGLQGPPGAGAVVRDANGAFVGSVDDTYPGFDPNNPSYPGGNPWLRVVREIGGRTLAFHGPDSGVTW